MSKIALFITLLVSLLFSACAFDLAHVSFTPTVCSPKFDKSFKVAKETITVGAPCDYNRTIAKGTAWNMVGTVPQGEVYKSKDQALTVECSNIHEAYLVVSQGSLVGFYLPVEKGFVKLSKAIALNIE